MKHAICFYLALFGLASIRAQTTLLRPTFASGGNSAPGFTYTLGEANVAFDTAAPGSLSVGAQPGDDKTGVDAPAQPPLAGIALFPNPTNGLLKVDIDPAYTRPLLGVLFDAAGKRLAEYTLPSGLTEIDLCTQPAGHYVLTLQSAGQAGSWTIIKH